MRKVIASNKKAFYQYFLEQNFEAGMVLVGSEIKSLRLGKVNINDAHASFYGNELFIYNVNISQYDKSSYQNHYTTRPRKLLMHRQELKKLIGKIKEKGYTLIPVQLYFNQNNIAKVEIALAKGKKLVDKRRHIKERDWKREQGSLAKKEAKLY